MKSLLKKSFFVFNLTRAHNIILVFFAIYLSAIFFLSEKTPLQVLQDKKIFLIASASAISIAAGYIINDFYDKEKDIINKPVKVYINNSISQNSQLILYFALNALASLVAWLSSVNTLIFFSVYIFGMWFYSHKLKKIPLVGNISYTLLSLIPFLALILYYRNFDLVILSNGVFLFVLVLIKEFVKDLENLKGDLALNYQTIAVKYGENTSKKIISILSITNICISIFISIFFQIGAMKYYFIVCASLLILLSFFISKFKNTAQFKKLHYAINFTLLVGIFSLVLVKIR